MRQMWMTLRLLSSFCHCGTPCLCFSRNKVRVDIKSDERLDSPSFAVPGGSPCPALHPMCRSTAPPACGGGAATVPSWMSPMSSLHVDVCISDACRCHAAAMPLAYCFRCHAAVDACCLAAISLPCRCCCHAIAMSLPCCCYLRQWPKKQTSKLPWVSPPN